MVNCSPQTQRQPEVVSRVMEPEVVSKEMRRQPCNSKYIDGCWGPGVGSARDPLIRPDDPCYLPRTGAKIYIQGC